MPEILANARLVLESETVRGSVVIEGAAILAVETGPRVPAGALDCEGDYLAPGLIELHTDNLERHMQPRPGVIWPIGAAIMAHDRELGSAGITTVFDALRVGSILSEKKLRYRKYARPVASEILARRAAGMLKISHFLHLRAEICSETLPEELGEFTAEDRIGILSLMDHTPGQRQFRDTGKMAAYLAGKYAMGNDDVDAYFGRLQALSARVRDGHRRTAVEAGGRLGATLASHDDTTAADVAASRDFGCRIAEFPTTVAAAQASHAAGLAVVMGAPNYLRGGSHSGNVSAAELAAAGVLDILSSDYVPASLLHGAVQMGIDLGDLARGIRAVTAVPATVAGLEDRGTIAVGRRADLLRFSIIDDMPVIRAVWSNGQRI